MSRPHSNNPLKSGGVPDSAPGFLRRLAAIVYDLFLLLALLFAATLIVLPLNNGEAFSSTQYFYPLYLLAVSFLFYAWFWTHGGQTLGMRAWKIKVLTCDRKPIGWSQACLRFAAALLSVAACGLGFVWILIDPHRRAWHDRLSGTALFFDAGNPSA
ncbi:RDD family protein [Methylosarcina fibrata]|uniref:RDD family protein n=1 Tax=Methylosarcina fibrata TaxID=105972 RepID=UPI0003632327|nr:RDD family protein [Methylosarcina fibrata]